MSEVDFTRTIVWQALKVVSKWGKGTDIDHNTICPIVNDHKLTMVMVKILTFWPRWYQNFTMVIFNIFFTMTMEPGRRPNGRKNRGQLTPLPANYNF